MRRAATVVLAAVGLAFASPAHAACPSPVQLKFERKAGKTRGKLSWSRRPGTPSGTRYRVRRNGAVIGQTRGLDMRVRVSVNQ